MSQLPDQVVAWLVTHALGHGYVIDGAREPCSPDECAACAALEWFAVNAPSETSDLVSRYAGFGWAWQTRVGTINWRQQQAQWSVGRRKALIEEGKDNDGSTADLP